MKPPLLEVGARYDIEYVGADLTIQAMRGARLVGTRRRQDEAEYVVESRREGGCPSVPD